MKRTDNSPLHNFTGEQADPPTSAHESLTGPWSRASSSMNSGLDAFGWRTPTIPCSWGLPAQADRLAPCELLEKMKGASAMNMQKYIFTKAKAKMPRPPVRFGLGCIGRGHQ
jgi:hypothetical protein